MPYIVKEKRLELDPYINNLGRALAGLEADDENNNMEGNLNYIITRLLMLVYGDRSNTRYAQINDAIGLLECAKLEFYRKVAASYEDQKEFENGAVDASLPPLQTSEVVVEDTSDIDPRADVHGVT